MPTLADSLLSSSARQLALRVRPDLAARQHRYQGRVYWVVKDPVGLHYFRFQEEEFAILHMLDGQTSLDEMKKRFERDFPPQKITVEELGQFIGMLHKSGLVIADVSGQGLQLKKRGEERKRKEMLSTLGNILAIRFKGIDPDRILNWIYPKISWFYSPWTSAVVLVLALSALSLVAVQFDVFRNKLPSFHQFFTAENWFWLAIVLACTKVLHEFGHGLTCKHFGGECHEMGVMFLVLTPCLYCNVSDSWMLPNKWHRAWIGAAGMYVEIVLASICTFIWWFSSPGLLNQVCLSTMFVCSVSTVVFNANPLLRYDGYYILSDLTEIPNLRQKASTILSRKLATWCLGLEEPDDPFLPQRNQMFFALYTVAAGIYRWVVLFSILWFLYRVLEPYGLKVVSQTLALISVTTLIASPVYKVGKYFSVPGRLEQVKRSHVQTTVAVLSVVLLFAFLVPLPYRIVCTLEIKPRDAESVYVDVPGRLMNIAVKPGQTVTAGQLLGELRSVDLQVEIAKLEGEIAEADAQLDALIHARSVDEREEATLEIPQVEEHLNSLKRQVEQRRFDFKRLSLTAPVDGTVLPPPETPNQPDPNGRLPKWSGSPLEEKNLGALLAETVLFCQIGDPKRMEAVLIVGQDEMEFVSPGQSVALQIYELPGRRFRSEISEIALSDLKVSPRRLSNKAGGELITETDPAGRERPQTPSYQALCPLDNADGLLVIGMRGQGKVSGKWQTLAARTWRLLIRTFNFKL